jgi:hypothetical protein
LAALIFCAFGSSPIDRKKPDMPCSLFYCILFGGGLQYQQGTMVIYQGMIGGEVVENTDSRNPLFCFTGSKKYIL